MTRKIHQKRYSDAFKRMLMEEIRQGKWTSPRAAGIAYSISPNTVTGWMDTAGLTHLRNRAIEIKTLNEISELLKLRKVNRMLRDRLLDEVLARREDLAVLEAAGKEYGFTPASFREKCLRKVVNAG